jgi:hypothetical protein
MSGKAFHLIPKKRPYVCSPSVSQLSKSVSTQTIDRKFVSIFTPEGPNTSLFYEYLLPDSPDILRPFQNPNGTLIKSIAYAPKRHILRVVPKCEITPDTIVDCAGGSSSDHEYWNARKRKIILRNNLSEKNPFYFLHKRSKSEPPAVPDKCSFCAYCFP